jgi:AbrB family looped-hinge helix DNA binding protein
MINQETVRVGKRGIVTIPANLRKRFDLREGSQLLLEETEKGLLLRPAYTIPLEIYSDERVEEFDQEEERLGETLKHLDL